MGQMVPRGGSAITYRIALRKGGSALEAFWDSRTTYRYRTVSDFVQFKGIYEFVDSSMVLQVILVSQLLCELNTCEGRVENIIDIPPAKGR